MRKRRKMKMNEIYRHKALQWRAVLQRMIKRQNARTTTLAFQKPLSGRSMLQTLPSGPRVPHVTNFFAPAPSSLLFCGVRDTHKYLAFCKFFEEFGKFAKSEILVGVAHSAEQ